MGIRWRPAPQMTNTASWYSVLFATSSSPRGESASPQESTQPRRFCLTQHMPLPHITTSAMTPCFTKHYVHPWYVLRKAMVCYPRTDTTVLAYDSLPLDGSRQTNSSAPRASLATWSAEKPGHFPLYHLTTMCQQSPAVRLHPPVCRTRSTASLRGVLDHTVS